MASSAFFSSSFQATANNILNKFDNAPIYNTSTGAWSFKDSSGNELFSATTSAISLNKATTVSTAKNINSALIGVTSGSMAANDYTSIGLVIRNSVGGAVASSGDSTGAELRCVQPGTGTNAGQLEIYTRTDATTLTKGLVISSAGAVTLGATSGTTTVKHLAYGYDTSAAGAVVNQGALCVYNRSTTVDATALNVVKGANDTSTSNRLITFLINAGTGGSGQINANGASACAFGTFSDRRLKENITGLSGELVNILALKPSEFDYKDGSGHQIGFIAQEIEEIYPDTVNCLGETETMKTVTGWGKTEARLVCAIQELHTLLQAEKARNDALQTELDTKVSALEARLAALESK